MHFGPLCLFFVTCSEVTDHWQGGKVCSCLGWWVWIACPSNLGLIHTTHTLSHTHTHLSHTTHPLTHPHTHPLMHPNKHASHTRQMYWLWRCSRWKESHSPSCLGVQRGRVLETSISNKYVTAHIHTPKYSMSISTYPTRYYTFTHASISIPWILLPHGPLGTRLA